MEAGVRWGGLVVEVVARVFGVLLDVHNIINTDPRSGRGWPTEELPIIIPNHSFFYILFPYANSSQQTQTHPQGLLQGHQSAALAAEAAQPAPGARKYQTKDTG